MGLYYKNKFLYCGGVLVHVSTSERLGCFFTRVNFHKRAVPYYTQMSASGNAAVFTCTFILLENRCVYVCLLTELSESFVRVYLGNHGTNCDRDKTKWFS